MNKELLVCFLFFIFYFVYMETIVITTGWFDPLHVWHIRLFQEASQLGKLIVWLNSDERLRRKKWKPFMEWNERREILLELQSVSEVIAFDDDEQWSARDAIHRVVSFYKGTWSSFIFAKWWDRTAKNIPETDICDELWVVIEYGIWWVDKPQSSSWLLKNRAKFSEHEGRIDTKRESFTKQNYWNE